MIERLYWYIDERSNVPALNFVRALTKKERAKIREYIQALKFHGHNLRRPMADYLGQGIYESNLQTCLKRKAIIEELGENIIEIKGDDL